MRRPTMFGNPNAPALDAEPGGKTRSGLAHGPINLGEKVKKASRPRRRRRADFILDEDVPQGEPRDQCVGCLLEGEGHRVEKVQGTELEGADDRVLVNYAAGADLVVVTLDHGVPAEARKQACRCLMIKPPERTARLRLRQHYRRVVALFDRGSRIVVLPRSGEPFDADAAGLANGF